jgi:large subunit ribosomal protein L36
MTADWAAGIRTSWGPFCEMSGGEESMKVRNSLKSLKHKPGAIVVRRGRRTIVVNKSHPRWKARQG